MLYFLRAYKEEESRTIQGIPIETTIRKLCGEDIPEELPEGINRHVRGWGYFKFYGPHIKPEEGWGKLITGGQISIYF